MNHRTRILGGLWALVLAAPLLAAGEFVLARPDLLMTPAAEPEAFAEMVTGSGFLFYAIRGLVGVALETAGMIAGNVLWGLGALWIFIRVWRGPELSY